MNRKYLDPDGVYRFPDKREVCDLKSAKGNREYYNRNREMAARQDEVCPLCNEFMVSPVFEHQEGRGMSAAWRDDRIEVDGKWFNAALCWGCNRDKGGRRYHWLNGAYVPQGERHGSDGIPVQNSDMAGERSVLLVRGGIRVSCDSETS